MRRVQTRRENFPYYKVQFKDPVLAVWKDHRRQVFRDLGEAKSYLAALPPETETQIIEWREDGPRKVAEGWLEG